MPSSSTRDSKGEEQLILLYQLIFLRFWLIGWKEEAWQTTDSFEILLDWVNDGHLTLPNTVKDDSEWLQKWERYILKQKRSDNVSAAADHMCDAAMVLRNFGRTQEADWLLPWVEETQALAREAKESEDYKVGHGYYTQGG